MVEIIYTDTGSHDWIQVKDGDETVFQGYWVDVIDLANILKRYTDVTVIEKVDTDIQELLMRKKEVLGDSRMREMGLYRTWAKSNSRLANRAIRHSYKIALTTGKHIDTVCNTVATY